MAFTADDHSLRETQETADVVVEGRVTSYRFDEQPHMVFVRFTVEVTRVLLGESPSSIEVSLPGGKLADGRALIVPGAPYLSPGDHVLLHLSEWPEQTAYRIDSWHHGVVREELGGAYIGADKLPLASWGCDTIDGGAVESLVAATTTTFEDEPMVPEVAPRQEPLTWTSAVAAARACLSEVAQ